MLGFRHIRVSTCADVRLGQVDVACGLDGSDRVFHRVGIQFADDRKVRIAAACRVGGWPIHQRLGSLCAREKSAVQPLQLPWPSPVSGSPTSSQADPFDLRASDCPSLWRSASGRQLHQLLRQPSNVDLVDVHRAHGLYPLLRQARLTVQRADPRADGGGRAVTVAPEHAADRDGPRLALAKEKCCHSRRRSLRRYRRPVPCPGLL